MKFSGQPDAKQRGVVVPATGRAVLGVEEKSGGRENIESRKAQLVQPAPSLAKSSVVPSAPSVTAAMTAKPLDSGDALRGEKNFAGEERGKCGQRRGEGTPTESAPHTRKRREKADGHPEAERGGDSDLASVVPGDIRNARNIHGPLIFIWRNSVTER